MHNACGSYVADLASFFFCVCTAWHVGSWFPNQGSIPRPCGRFESQPLSGLPGKSQGKFNNFSINSKHLYSDSATFYLLGQLCWCLMPSVKLRMRLGDSLVTCWLGRHAHCRGYSFSLWLAEMGSRVPQPKKLH